MGNNVREDQLRGIICELNGVLNDMGYIMHMWIYLPVLNIGTSLYRRTYIQRKGGCDFF